MPGRRAPADATASGTALHGLDAIGRCAVRAAEVDHRNLRAEDVAMSGSSRTRRWSGSVMKPPGRMALTVAPRGARPAAVTRLECRTARSLSRSAGCRRRCLPVAPGPLCGDDRHHDRLLARAWNRAARLSATSSSLAGAWRTASTGGAHRDGLSRTAPCHGARGLYRNARMPAWLGCRRPLPRHSRRTPGIHQSRPSPEPHRTTLHGALSVSRTPARLGCRYRHRPVSPAPGSHRRSTGALLWPAIRQFVAHAKPHRATLHGALSVLTRAATAAVPSVPRCTEFLT